MYFAFNYTIFTIFHVCNIYFTYTTFLTMNMHHSALWIFFCKHARKNTPQNDEEPSCGTRFESASTNTILWLSALLHWNTCSGTHMFLIHTAVSQESTKSKPARCYSKAAEKPLWEHEIPNIKTIFRSKWYIHPVLTIDRTHAEYDQDIILVIFHLFGQLFGRTFQEREQDSQPYTLSQNVDGFKFGLLDINTQ